MSLSILSRFLDSRRPIDQGKFEYFKKNGMNDKMFRASEMPYHIRSQLFTLAAEAIQKLEDLILQGIDSFLPARAKARVMANIPNPLVLGLCARRLSLYYRRIMMRYKQFGEGTSFSLRASTSINSRPQPRKLAGKMPRACTML